LSDRISLADGNDVTSQLPPPTAAELAGTLTQPLAEGEHTVAVKVFDRAGNQAVIRPHVFTVDTVPPVVVIEVPHDGDFLGDGQQLIRIAYSDPNGDAPDGTIDPASVKVTVDGVDKDGKAVHSEWTGKFDGKDYPVTGNPNEDARSYKKIDDHTLEFTSKKDGKAGVTGKVVLAADGKSRTVTTTVTDSSGKKTTSVAVYDKQ